jgi:hypothetical protein
LGAPLSSASSPNVWIVDFVRLLGKRTLAKITPITSSSSSRSAQSPGSLILLGGIAGAGLPGSRRRSASSSDLISGGRLVQRVLDRRQYSLNIL